jgi:hypothetical protein
MEKRKQFSLYVPSVLVVWQDTTGQSGAFTMLRLNFWPEVIILRKGLQKC